MTLHRRCDLSLAEVVRVHRRRTGLTRAQLGQRLRQSWRWVAEVERGVRPMDPALIEWQGSQDLTPAERCWVYRRRCDMTQAQVAADLGVSRLWVNKMEKGLENADTLIWYWEQ